MKRRLTQDDERDEKPVLITYYRPRHFIYVRAYKSAVVLGTPDGDVWMTAADAEKVARALLRSAKLRRQIDKDLRAAR